MGADRRAHPGPRLARCVAPCVRAQLLATRPQRAQAAAGHLLLAAGRKPAPGLPAARGGPACGCRACPRRTGGRGRLAPVTQGAVSGHRGWPQHLAHRPRYSAAKAAPRGRQTPGRAVAGTIVLAAACAVQLRGRNAVGRRSEVLAGVCGGEVGRAARALHRLVARRSGGRRRTARRPHRPGRPPCQPARAPRHRGGPHCRRCAGCRPACQRLPRPAKSPARAAQATAAAHPHHWLVPADGGDPRRTRSLQAWRTRFHALPTEDAGRNRIGRAQAGSPGH